MNEDFLLSSYDYELPKELIAQHPANKRDHSRLLIFNKEDQSITHDFFYNLCEYLPQDSCLVFNESKVFPSRVKGAKPSGGAVELFFLKLNVQDKTHEVLVKANSKKRIGDIFLVEVGQFEIISITDKGTFLVKSDIAINDFLNQFGEVPIPPYIRGGESCDADKLNYQTVYAKNIGSAAAPTAGLHFTSSLFEKLEDKKIQKSFVNLHVGLGTFKPVDTDDIRDFKIHSEYFFVDEANLKTITDNEKKIAVGTTSLRVLESLESGFANYGETNIFLYPGKKIKSVSGLVTNFHLPKSSLLMLVSSMIGREKALEIYNVAVKEKYRFFSYGDAMLII